MKRKQYKVPEAQISMFDFDHPNMPVLDVSRCEARLINYETAARMVETYHYARRVPSIVVAVGMFVDGVLAGVCTYGIPPNRNALAFCGEEYIERGLELNRLFIHDWAGRNAESWLVGQTFRIMNSGYYRLLISYADPNQNHIGYIYQATNWIYTGTGSESKSDVIVNGNKISEKHLYNLYGTHERSKLRDNGLVIQDIVAPPKHRYVYFLGNRRQRRELRKALKWPVLPYPKAGQ